MKRLSIARTLVLALAGLTVLLAVVAGLAVAALYDARQRYEDDLARAYATEVATANMLAAGVVEETVLRSRRGGAGARARAAAGFDTAAAAAQEAARGDGASERLVAEQIAAQERARGGGAAAIGEALREGRRAATELSRRQAVRRVEARAVAQDDSRRAVVTAGIAGGLALIAALALVSLLVAGLRRPLAGLVGATRRLADGDLSARVEPEGPLELRQLAASFNSMAADLEAARARVETGRRRLATVIESLGDGLVMCDAHGRVVQVNPRATALVPELTPGRSVATDGGPLPPLGEALDREAEIEHGHRTLSVTAARLGPAKEDGVVWTVRDVTERARLEHAKSDFVATASHELRSPLTSIKGFVELLAGADLSERHREFVDIILLSTNRLVELVNDLLDVARFEAGKLEIQRRPISVAEAVREVAQLMRPRLEEKRQTLELELAPALPSALADAARVRQIVTNLLTNAHLYTPEGGRITISAGAAGEHVLIAVADTGPGMDADQVERVFERFYRGTRDGQAGSSGSGLGLSIVKSLVDLHGGTINVQSEPGVGTTFTVRLPRAPAATDMPEPRHAIHGKRVLVVEDEPEVARLIAEQLQPYEVEAVVVHSGEEALRKLRSDRFDAVTLDILLGGLDGFEVLRAIRDDPKLRRTPIVVVSVFAGQDALAGEWSVAKPIDAEELTDAVGSAMLAGRSRVLVVGRAHLREVVGTALERRGIDFAWATNGTEAARLCEETHFEVAMVDAGMRAPQTALAGLDLRGRRLHRSVVVFSTGEESAGMAKLDADLVRVEDATQAVVAALRDGAGG